MALAWERALKVGSWGWKQGKETGGGSRCNPGRQSLDLTQGAANPGGKAQASRRF